MTRECRFYIAHRIINYINDSENPRQFMPHEVSMFIADCARDLELGDVGEYEHRLRDEWSNTGDEEALELIELLKEAKR